MIRHGTDFRSRSYYDLMTKRDGGYYNGSADCHGVVAI
jgi:hypothetical protein